MLSLHAAFLYAPDEILAELAIIARNGGVRSTRTRRASSTILAWKGLTEAISRARSEYRNRPDARVAYCCGTPEQRAYLRALFRYYNATRFAGALPDDIPVRLSARMKAALGHMLPGEDQEGRRRVAEIALNVDLMLPGNGHARVDTLLHEMAHAADYLRTGHRGHGPSWRAVARKVGCDPTTVHDRPIEHRSRRRQRVTRVPPLPGAVRRFLD